MAYSPRIYGSWKQAQLEKYEDLWPRVRKYLEECSSLLDVGIGPAWLEQFLEEKRIRLRRVVGVDADPKMVEPKRPGIEYAVAKNFETGEKFDLVACFDTVHLLAKPERLFKWSEKYVLVAVPVKWKQKIPRPPAGWRAAERGEIGASEKDWFALFQRKPPQAQESVFLS